MAEYNSNFVKFTYTILDPRGIPQSKSWIINLNYVISVETTAANDLRIILTNNQIISIDVGREIDANEVLDSTTATKLAEAFLEVMKDRKNTVDFSCMSPKYNHLEIGDIIDFSNWPSGLKIYGSAMAGYFIVSEITKRVNGCSIKAIKVS